MHYKRKEAVAVLGALRHEGEKKVVEAAPVRPQSQEVVVEQPQEVVTRGPRDVVTHRRRTAGRKAPEGRAQGLWDYRDVPLVQIGCRVPTDLHEIAQEIAFDERNLIKGGVGAIYTALLHRLRTDKELEQWVRRFLQA